jgi:hypothetical protein
VVISRCPCVFSDLRDSTAEGLCEISKILMKSLFDSVPWES